MRVVIAVLTLVWAASSAGAKPAKWEQQLKADQAAEKRCMTRVKKLPQEQQSAASLLCREPAAKHLLDVMASSGRDDLEEKVIDICEQLIPIYEKANALDSPALLYYRDLLAKMYDRRGDVVHAARAYHQLLAQRERAKTDDDALRAKTLSLGGAAAYERGVYPKAVKEWTALLALQQGADRAKTLISLGAAAFHAGDLTAAAETFARADKELVAAGVDRSEPTRYALLLTNLARLHIAKAEYAEARALGERATSIVKPVADKADERIAAAKNTPPAGTTASKQALEADLRALEMSELAAIGGSIPPADRHQPYVPALVDVTACMQDLGALKRKFGDLDGAEALLRQALAIDEQNLGTQHETIAVDRNNIGDVLYAKEDFAHARELFDSAVDVLEVSKGQAHPDVAGALQNAALARLALGEPDDATALLERARGIMVTAVGEHHPNVAIIEHNLAEAERARGKLDDAIAHERAAYDILKAVYGDRHPGTARAIASLARLTAAKGDVAAAVGDAAKGGDAMEQSTSTILSLGSEAEKLAYFEHAWRETSGLVALHLRYAPRSPDAARAALTAVIRRKGRVLEAVSDATQAARTRARPEDRELLDKLTDARARLARLVFAGLQGGTVDDFKARFDPIQTEIHSLENALSTSQVSLLDGVSVPVTIDQIQHALPAKTALIELVAFRPYDPRAKTEQAEWGARTFAAYVLRPDGDPVGVELGTEAEIDALVFAFRHVLADPRTSDNDVRTAGRALYAKVLAPLRAAIGDDDELLIAPDGSLNLVPFEALVDDNNKFVVESKLVTYLGSARDIVRPRSPAAPIKADVFANPDFDLAVTTTASDPMAARGSPFDHVSFDALPGTNTEARTIQHALGAGATVHVGKDASKTALLDVNGPPILHIATHGFFLGDVDGSSTTGGARGFVVDTGATTNSDPVIIPNPLLRSGLALAGANQSGSARAAGIVTALEASGMNLAGTKLVILSACETGLGDLRGADGVYGLRRALTIAGAETEVISMWKVDDNATARLMALYYAGLAHGGGRSNALRDARLALLADPHTHHPYFWASFIVSGEGGSLDGTHVGRTPPAVPPPVARGPRGCACDARGDATSTFGLAALVLVVMLVRRRR